MKDSNISYTREENGVRHTAEARVPVDKVVPTFVQLVGGIASQNSGAATVRVVERVDTPRLQAPASRRDVGPALVSGTLGLAAAVFGG
jgi:hypothetical protein